MDISHVDLSRIQFGLTAMYHFLFVPLTLGLCWLLFIMETLYVMTNKPIWKEATKFWGLLFGINFAMGVATGITMEFQFGTNWAYYSHFVGDIFGVPLAIEGLMAFFLEATFVGLFFFGWDRLSKVGHLTVTFLLALGTNLSGLWILIANGWMQNPVGAKFNPDTMRMELTSFADVFFNPVAQAKFVHTLSAGYVLAAIFVLAISAWYMLKGRHIELAKRSMVIAISFGLASALSVVVLGDESGYLATEHQKMKVAAIEAEWHTQPAPAAFNVFAIPDVAERKNHAEVKIPWLMGLITTRSLDKEFKGIHDLVDETEDKIRSSIVTYDMLERYRKNKDDMQARAHLEERGRDIGYALLLKKFVDDPRKATPEQIRQAAEYTIPNVAVLFWAFRVMVGLGMWFIALFAIGFWYSAKRELLKHKWYLKAAMLSLPLPWIAIQLGWVVAEYGRQPWSVEGILPTFMAASNVPAANVWITLIGFVVFYSALAVVDVYLLRKYIMRGPKPDAMKTEIAA